MGIDARMLVRYRGEKPTDEQLNRWSWDLCRSIGADNFNINDGCSPEEYNKTIEICNKAFNSHSEYPRCKVDRSIREVIVADIGECPKCLSRAIELTNRQYPIDDDNSCIPIEFREPGRCWIQDGETIFANHDEWFFEISLCTRYYGKGYERGNILILCAVAEWCEHNLQPCEVWYGGDSSGVEAEPFGEEARLELRRHLYSPNGRDYFKYDDAGYPTPKPCGLCVDGENRFNRYGWGDNYIAVSCAGCGKCFASRDDGKSWIEEKK